MADDAYKPEMARLAAFGAVMIAGEGGPINTLLKTLSLTDRSKFYAAVVYAMSRLMGDHCIGAACIVGFEGMAVHSAAGMTEKELARFFRKVAHDLDPEPAGEKN